ncbi:tannase/feruloyl esterase family alpha/beta hydrolase [Marinobacter sp. JSM 1782161]|uniref:tannase/feruloyl esterase family alpha/beta hydrolase n=1 Tax=Marinobacter sp. JSM 1782161 TaxID=2685906 RepID=UPI001401DDF7|nr:tannase/feruloyl esterase family alpha/beta hydrolase [Marinobacter sp. JSM 1782161]
MNKMNSHRTAGFILGPLVGVSLVLGGCVLDDDSSDADQASNDCAALEGMTIAASDIGLATGGATVTSASQVAAADASAGVDYCLVVGEIHPETESEVIHEGTADEVEVATPDINFNVALPADWNYKTLQYGGGGFDGTIPSVDRASENGIESALARGYTTLGSDSGHVSPAIGGDPNELWNSEALRNFGREQIKKTHDAASAIVRAYYQTSPDHSYFMGGSQGGHEALIAAQFYPDDYDGVIAGYPAYNPEAMHLGAMDYGKTLYNARTAGVNGYSYDADAGDGWISRTQTRALSQYIVDACENDSLAANGGEALDGAADGMVSDAGACRQLLQDQGYDLLAHDATNPMRCAGGAHTSTDHAVSDEETCLSDPQIETLARITSRYNLPTGLVLDGGVRSYGHWPMLDGIWIAEDESKNLGNQEDFGSEWDAYDAFQASFPSQDQYNIITQSAYTQPSDILQDFDPANWIDRITTLSGWIDTSSVDYSTFRSQGGKLIHYHGAADVSITPYNSVDLYLRMIGQFSDNTDYLGTNPFWGTDDATTNMAVSQNDESSITIDEGVVNDFYSFYLIPGFGHGHGYYTASVDWLTALENWVEQDVAPKDSLVSTDVSGNELGSRPVCHFPYYPAFTSASGTDTNDADNYSCEKLEEYAYLP